MDRCIMHGSLSIDDDQLKCHNVYILCIFPLISFSYPFPFSIQCHSKYVVDASIDIV